MLATTRLAILAVALVVDEPGSELEVAADRLPLPKLQGASDDSREPSFLLACLWERSEGVVLQWTPIIHETTTSTDRGHHGESGVEKGCARLNSAPVTVRDWRVPGFGDASLAEACTAAELSVSCSINRHTQWRCSMKVAGGTTHVLRGYLVMRLAGPTGPQHD